MKIVVDYDLCEANGVCVDLCEDVFVLSDDDELSIVAHEVTEARRAVLTEAARMCPRGALSLVETDPT